MPLTTKQRLAQRKKNHRFYQKHRAEILAKLKTPEAKEYNRKRAQRYRERNPFAYRGYKLRLQEAEAGRVRPDHCEICGATDQAIMFDHCHQRGVFRGWICNNCNHALGCVNDDPDRLRKLIAYLERTKDIIPPQLTLPV